MATFARKCFSPKKYFKFLITQNIQTLLKIPTILVAEIREKKSYNFRGNYSFLDVFGHRTKSDRGNWWFRFPHVLSAFGALYISFSNPAECMNNEESLFSMSKIGIAESPEKQTVIINGIQTGAFQNYAQVGTRRKVYIC